MLKKSEKENLSSHQQWELASHNSPAPTLVPTQIAIFLWEQFLQNRNLVILGLPEKSCVIFLMFQGSNFAEISTSELQNDPNPNV